MSNCQLIYSLVKKIIPDSSTVKTLLVIFRKNRFFPKGTDFYCFTINLIHKATHHLLIHVCIKIPCHFARILHSYFRRKKYSFVNCLFGLKKSLCFVSMQLLDISAHLVGKLSIVKGNVIDPIHVRR